MHAIEAYPEEWLLMLEMLSLGDENLEQPLRNALAPCLHAQPDLAALIEG